MLLNGLIMVCIAAFVGLAALGHILLLGDARRFWGTAKQPQERGGAEALRVPAE
jgi:hypothetical protein